MWGVADVWGVAGTCGYHWKKFIAGATLVDGIQINANAANQIIFSRIFIVDLHVQAIVAFYNVEGVLVIPAGSSPAVGVRFGAPLLSYSEAGRTLHVAIRI